MTRGIINRRKEAALSLERARELLDYDPSTGQFVWRVDGKGGWKNRKKGTVAGTPRKLKNGDGYPVIWIDGHLFVAHRLAWFHFYGYWPYPYLDHINQNKTDNRITNLRIASRAQNNINTGRRSDGVSPARGVYWSLQNKKWIAQIAVNSEYKYLGQYDDIEDAIEARRRGEIEYYGKFSTASKRDHASMRGEGPE